MAAGTQVASLHAKISADAKNFERGMKSVKSDLTAGEKLAHGLGTALVTAFKVGAAAAAAFAGGVGLAVKKAADMEQQVADINAIMGLTSEEVERLDKLILDLGLDPNLKVSATEAADAIQMLGKNGVTMSQIMDGAARSTVLLANATDADFAVAADIATDVMQQFNISAANMNDAVNGIAGVTQSSKFDIDDYRLAIAQAGGVASSVGVSFDDFNAVIAAISPSFAGGSDAGTSFKTMLQRLVPASNDAQDLMQQLGLEFFDSSGKMKDMTDIAQELRDGFGGLSEAQKIEAASTIFGTDAMRAAFAMANAGSAEIAQLKEVIGKVDAEEMAAKRMDTFAGALEILGGVMESLQIQIGQAFLPPLRSIVEAFTALASKYGPPVVAWFGQFAGILEASGRYLAAWIDDGDYLNDWLSHLPEPLEQAFLWFRDVSLMVKDFWANLQIAIKVIQAIVEPLINALSKWVSWKDVLTALGLIMGGTLLVAIGGFIAAMWPVIALIAQVTAAVAVLRWAWTNDFLQIRSITESTLEKITQWAKQHFGSLEFALSDAGDYWADIYGFRVPTILVNFVGMVKQWIMNIKMAIIGFYNIWMERFNTWKADTVRVFNQAIIDITTPIKHWVGTTRIELAAWLDIWKVKIKNWYDDLVYRFDQMLEKVKEFRDEYFGWFRPEDWAQMARNWIQGLWNGVTEKWNAFIQWWRDRWQDLKNGWNQFWQSHSPSQWFADAGISWMEGLGNGIAQQIPWVEAQFGELAGSVRSVMQQMNLEVNDNANAILANVTKLSNVDWSQIAAAAAMVTGANKTMGTGSAAVAKASGIDPMRPNNQATGGALNSVTPIAPKISNFIDQAAGIFGYAARTWLPDVLGDFSSDLMSLFTGPGQNEFIGVPVRNALATIGDPNVENTSTSSLIAAIQTLVAEISARGLGSAFNVNMAPTATGDTATDIRATVEYLQALYA